MVPNPISDSATKTPIREVKNSGAEPPAAMNVAPATSSLSESRSEICSSASTSAHSHTQRMGMGAGTGAGLGSAGVRGKQGAGEGTARP